MIARANFFCVDDGLRLQTMPKGFLEHKSPEGDVRRKLNFEGSSDGELSTSAGSAGSGEINEISV